MYTSPSASFESSSTLEHNIHSFDTQSDSGLDIEQLLNNFDENDPIFNNKLLYPTPIESEILHFDEDGNVINGTIEALITYITSPDVLNYQFLINLFLTFRSYIDPLPLLELLLCRLSWSLKKSLSEDKEEKCHGRLILIRAFVTIRHWLLNHFQDDFIDNIILRSLFTNTINEFSKNERYKGKEAMSLQCKILKDLKKIYLTLAAIYWDIEYDDKNLINTNISSYNNLNKSRMSILGMNQLNDPATRRSTLLYMLENPNSSNALNDALKKSSPFNIFNIEKSKNSPTKMSPLESYLHKKSKHLKKENGKVSSNNVAGNTVLYPKDSLNLFDVKKLKNSASTNSSIDQIYTSLFDSGSVFGFVDLKIQTEKLPIDGFTTSGHINIFKDSKINEIKSASSSVDISQVATFKKTEEVKPLTKTNGLSVKASHRNNDIHERGKNRTKAKKRSFIKSLFIQNSKENIYFMTPPVETKEEDENEKVLQKTPFQQQQRQTDDEPVEVILFREKDIIVNDNSIDYLEELLIRDYQIIIQHPRFKHRFSKQLRNSKRTSVLSMSFDICDRESRFNPLDSPTKQNLLQYDEGDLETSINLNLNKRKLVEDKSFRSPSCTIDWSDSMNVDETNNNQFVDMNGILTDEIDELDDMSELKSTQTNMHNNNNNDNSNNKNENKNNTDHHHNHNNNNSNLITSNDTGYLFENIADIDYTQTSKSRASLQNTAQLNRLSRISRKKKCISDSKILMGFSSKRNSKYSMISQMNNDSIDRNTKFSINMLTRSSCISTKSYITYDSQFSESSNLSEGRNEYVNVLNRKHAFSNLRVNNISDKDTASVDVPQSVEGTVPENSGVIDINNNTIPQYQERKSIDALSYLQKLPYFGYVFHANTESTLSIIPSPSASQACYTALSPDDIHDLAAIPDQPLAGDPLNYTLSKLRGDRANPKVIVGLNDSKLDEEESHRKHAVAVVCESPTKTDNGFNCIDLNMASDDSNNEIELERQVRDLIISNKPAEENKLEMNLVSTQNAGKKMKDNGSVLTRVSTGQMLKDDTEKSCFEMNSLLTTPKTGLETIKPLLSVHQIMDQKLHIPFIFNYDSAVLAQQMTLIERDIILEIDWKDLINLKWDQPLTPYNSWLRLLIDLSEKSGLELITLRFNLVNNWIISEILLCNNPNLRILAITRFIQLAQTCREVQNYGTLFQIMLALNSEVMKQLKSTWIRVDPGTILKFKELRDLTSPNNDFENYRMEISRVIPSKGFIPFLPLGLSDLTMYSEMPTILPSVDIGDLDSLTGFEAESVARYDLINFKKFSCIGDTVKNILRYIEWSKFYKFDSNPEVLSKCLYISSLSEEDMSICLQTIDF